MGMVIITVLLITIAVLLAYLVLQDRAESIRVDETVVQKDTVEEITPSVSEVVKKQTIEEVAPAPAEIKKKLPPEDSLEEKVPLFKPEISKITQSVVLLECYSPETGDWASSGSGISIYYDDGLHYILTNAHVVRIDGSFRGCWVYFPTENGYFYESSYWAGVGFLYDDAPVVVDEIVYGGGVYGDEGFDIAFLALTEPGVTADGVQLPPLEETIFPDALKNAGKVCDTADLAIGEEILVFGYPAIGGSNITLTDGIVSGFDGYSGEYVKTSAKIDQGNSGGLAIRKEDGCFIGIPTLSYTGVMESIGSILNYARVKPFVDAYDKGYKLIEPSY